MKSKFALFINEFKILLHSKTLWLIILLTDMLMIIGVNSINLSNLMRLHNIKRTSLTISLGSAKYGAMAGMFAFSIFTILTLSKDKRQKSKVIVETCFNYDILIGIRILTIFFYEIITIFIGMVMVILVQTFVYKVSFEVYPYVWSYVTIILPALFFATLISSGLYMLMESIDISILTIVILFFVNLTTENYLFQWIDLGDIVFSDFAGIRPVGKLIIYNRIFWLSVSILLVCFGFLARRRYEFNIVKSVFINRNNKILSMILVVTVFFTSFIYNSKPYTMKSNLVDAEPIIVSGAKLKRVNPEIYFNNSKETMQAHVIYEFKENKSNFIQFDTNDGLDIKTIKVNDEAGNYERILGTNKIKIPVPNTENINIEITYDGTIKYDKNGGIPGYICRDSIYLLEVSNYIFRPLTENDRVIEISGFYSAPENLTVVTPGKLLSVENKTGNKIWNFEFQSQSLNIGVFAAEYKKADFKIQGSQLEFYYSPKHERYIKEKNVEEHLKDMFNYYSDNIGEFYTEEYPLKIVESSIYKPGGHSSGNVISFGEYMVNREDSDDGSETYLASLPYDLEIIAHEMAHQWWGTGVEFDDNKAWSSEGFAQYLCYKYIQKEFGDNVAKGEFLMPWESKLRNTKNSYYLKNSNNLDKLNKKLRYQKEMERLHDLRYYSVPVQLVKAEKEKGESIFLKNLSEVYKKNKNKRLTYDMFLKEMELSKEVITLE